MAGLIWQALGPAPVHGPCSVLVATSQAARPRGRCGACGSPSQILSVYPHDPWLLALGSQFFRLQSVSRALPHPRDPTESPVQAQLCASKRPVSGASSSQHDHNMTGTLLGVWKSRGSILPNWLEEAVREGFLVEAAYEMNVEEVVGCRQDGGCRITL